MCQVYPGIYFHYIYDFVGAFGTRDFVLEVHHVWESSDMRDVKQPMKLRNRRPWGRPVVTYANSRTTTYRSSQGLMLNLGGGGGMFEPSKAIRLAHRRCWDGRSSSRGGGDRMALNSSLSFVVSKDCEPWCNQGQQSFHLPFGKGGGLIRFIRTNTTRYSCLLAVEEQDHDKFAGCDEATEWLLLHLQRVVTR